MCKVTTSFNKEPSKRKFIITIRTYLSSDEHKICSKKDPVVSRDILFPQRDSSAGRRFLFRLVVFLRLTKRVRLVGSDRSSGSMSEDDPTQRYKKTIDDDDLEIVKPVDRAQELEYGDTRTDLSSMRSISTLKCSEVNCSAAATGRRSAPGGGDT